MTVTVAEQIGAWAATVDRFSDQAQGSGRHLLLDTVGCIGHGASHPAGKRVLPACVDGGVIPILGTTAMATPRLAAYAMGTQGHAGERDDQEFQASVHTAASIVPALFAVGYGLSVNLGDVLHSLVIGVHTDVEIGLAMGLSHAGAGWHSTATIGVFGATTACCRIMGLDPRQTATALSIAASMSSGLKGEFGSDVKPMQVGAAAQIAVHAATMARHGATAKLDIFEGPDGFGKLYSGSTPPNWGNLYLPVSGETSAFRALTLKAYPCCASAHRCLGAISMLMVQHGFTAGQVISIVCKVGNLNIQNLKFPRPATPQEALFSMQHAVSRLLLNGGTLTETDFADTAMQDTRTRDLLGLTTVELLDNADEETGTNRLPHRVEIVLRDGSRFATSVQWPRGTLGTDSEMTEKELLGKFRESLALAPTTAVDRATGILLGPLHKVRVRELVDTLRY